MRISELSEGDVVDLDAHRKKRDRMDPAGMVSRVQDTIQLQSQIETTIQQQVNQIDQTSLGRKAAYRHPTVMADYAKDTNPVLAWMYEMFTAKDIHYYNTYPKYQFIYHEGMQHLEDFIHIMSKDMLRYADLLPETKKAPLPDHAARPIRRAMSQCRDAIDFFMKMREHKMVVPDDY